MTELKTLENTSIESKTSTDVMDLSEKTNSLFPNLAFMIYMAALAFWFFQIYTTF